MSSPSEDPAPDEPSPFTKLFGTMELAEHILKQLDKKDLLVKMRVNKLFHRVINSSKLIRRVLFFDQLPEDYTGTDRDVHNNLLISPAMAYFHVRPLYELLDLSDTRRNSRVAYRTDWRHDLIFPASHGSDAAPYHDTVGPITDLMLRHYQNAFKGQSLFRMHFRNRLTVTKVTFHNIKFMYTPDHWTDFFVEVKGATFGQLLEIVSSVKEAATWQFKGMQFQGLTQCDGARPKWDDAMGKSWQEAFKDKSLLPLVVATPSMVHRCSGRLCGGQCKKGNKTFYLHGSKIEGEE